MTRFDDGPAAGKILRLQRAPIFLRVVIEGDLFSGEVDALDQPEDTPKPTEKIIVYVRRGAAGRCHLLCSPRKNSGFFSLANYRHYPTQPPEDAARDPEKWSEWARAQEAQLFT